MVDMQAIVGSRVHLIEMASAGWSWSHLFQLSWESGGIIIPISPMSGWRSKSILWCSCSADHRVTIPDGPDSPNHCPFYCVSCLCAYYETWLLTSPPPNNLRVLTLLHVRFFFHAFLSIAYSHFNYISLIAFHRWAFSIFLSLPLVFK